MSRKYIKSSATPTLRNVSLAAFALTSMLAGGALAESDPAQSSKQQAATGGASAPAAANPALVRALMEDLQKRAGIINSMAGKFRADAAAQSGTGFNAETWGRDFGSRLMYKSSAELQSALSAPNLAMAQNELFNASAGRVAQKHVSDNNLNVNLITPCRIVDTRGGGGGQLGPSYRFWYAFNTPAIIAGQGGNAAGCGTFPSADGWVIYVTVVPPSGNVSPNFLTVQHDASPPVPTSSTMNYVNQNIANFAVVSNNGGSSSGGFYAYASGSTHVVIDLIGYVQGESAAALDCIVDDSSTQSVLNGASWNFDSGTCPSGYVHTGGGSYAFATDAYVHSQPRGPLTGGTETQFCFGRNVSGGTTTVRCTVVCCRMPGRP